MSVDIHRKSVDMDMDVKFHIHGNPASIGPKSLYFDTPLAFKAPDGGVPLGLPP